MYTGVYTHAGGVAVGSTFVAGLLGDVHVVPVDALLQRFLDVHILRAVQALYIDIRVYTYIHTYIHIHVYIWIYLYTYIFTQQHVYVYIYAYMYVNICMGVKGVGCGVWGVRCQVQCVQCRVRGVR